MFLTNFRRFPITFRRFPTIFQNCSEGLVNVSEHFPNIFRRFPKTAEGSRRFLRRQRTSNSDSRQKKDVLQNIRFSNYSMLAVFISLIKFSKIVFAVWNFVRSLSFTTKTISVRPCKLSKSIESDFPTLNWIAESEKIRYVYSSEILLNTATIREVNSAETDSNFTARETQDYAPLQRQTTNNQANFHNFKTRNWIYLQWLSLPV